MDAGRHAAGPHTPGAVQSLTAPMPATVIKVMATPGQAVKAGETMVDRGGDEDGAAVRAPVDGVVKAVHCREGELVQPEQILVELES